MSAPQQPSQNPLEVELPAGGKLHLQALDEVDLFEKQRERYINDYGLTQPNDLFILGALLQQQILAYRAQQGISGLEPQFDQAGLPTGHWAKAQKPDKDAAKKLTEATNQIRVLEQSLGVDKKSRESGGQYTVADYLKTLKAAGHQYGVHISKRVLKLEEVFNEAAWRIRLLQNGDAEDRSYHDLTPEKFIDWLAEQVKEVEDADKRFAQEKGKLFIGKV
jgi:hypothetical protein